MTTTTENPAKLIQELALSYAVPRCLYVVAEMGVADALGDSPRTAADLAASTGADAGALARVLRLISAHGVFEARNGGYVHTAASRLLRTDHPQSLRAVVRWFGAPIPWKSIEALGHSIRTGEGAAEQAFPEGVWAHLAQHPDESRVLDEAMAGKAHGQIAGILSTYDFSRFNTIADIGGSRGHLLQAVLDKVPNATGVLFDLPHVVQHAVARQSGRFKLQPGDFFKDTLPACDAYMVMQVIHDWSDPKAAEILRAIGRTAPAHAKLLLIEAIVPEDSHRSFVKTLDIFMLAQGAGKERTRREFEELLAVCGFRLDRVIDVGLGLSILEASVAS